MAKKHWIFTFALVVILSFVSFWQAFYFDFWRDDWYVVWGVLKNPFYMYQWGVSTLHPIAGIALMLAVWAFKWNTVSWEIYGFILRIIDSFFVYLFAISLTKSKKIGIFALFLFATTPIGIEAFDWGSAIATALLVPLFAACFYFWINNKKKIAWILIIVTMLCDPLRAIFLPLLLFMFDFLQKIQSTKKIPTLPLKKTGIFIVVCLFFFTTYLLVNKNAVTHFGAMYKEIFSFPFSIAIRKIVHAISIPFTSLGNLFFGWFLQIPDYADVGRLNLVSIILGIGSVAGTTYFSFLFFIQKRKILFVPLFLLLWAVILYLPNWIIGFTFIPATTNRYFTLSAVGIVILVAWLLQLLSRKYSYICLVLVILVNIVTTNKLMAEEFSYRSVTAVENLWSVINVEVPPREHNDIFIFQGDSLVTQYALLTAYNIPFGIRRNYQDPDEFPIVAVDDKTFLTALLCSKNFLRPSISSRIVLQKESYKISHVYSWYYDDKSRQIFNTSTKTREDLAKILPCQFTW